MVSCLLLPQAARHVAKLETVSATCRLAQEEELQILETELVVKDDTCAAFDAKKHDPYSLALVKNRLHSLRAQVDAAAAAADGKLPLSGLSAKCWAPPREATTAWPFYQDNTVFGVTYDGMEEVMDGEGWETHKMGPEGAGSHAPPGGWLVVAVFHTLWSQECLDIMPSLQELVPMHPYVKFVGVRADCRGLQPVAKKLGVEDFPTIMLLRGGVDTNKLDKDAAVFAAVAAAASSPSLRGEKETKGETKEGGETKYNDDGKFDPDAAVDTSGWVIGGLRTIEKLTRLLQKYTTDDDKRCAQEWRRIVRQREADELGIALDEEESEDEFTGSMEWTWDPEQCGENMRIGVSGLAVQLSDGAEGEAGQVTWEYRNKGGSLQWSVLPNDIQMQVRRL